MSVVVLVASMALSVLCTASSFPSPRGVGSERQDAADPSVPAHLDDTDTASQLYPPGRSVESRHRVHREESSKEEGLHARAAAAQATQAPQELRICSVVHSAIMSIPMFTTTWAHANRARYLARGVNVTAKLIGTTEDLPWATKAARAVVQETPNCDAFFGTGLTSVAHVAAVVVSKSWIDSASASTLSDKAQYPFFNRVYVDSRQDGVVGASVIKGLGITAVHTLCADDTYGRSATEGFAATASGFEIVSRRCYLASATKEELMPIVRAIAAQKHRSHWVYLAVAFTLFPVLFDAVHEAGLNQTLTFIGSRCSGATRYPGMLCVTPTVNDTRALEGSAARDSDIPFRTQVLADFVKFGATSTAGALIDFKEATTIIDGVELLASASGDLKLSAKLAATEKPFSSLDELSDRLVVLFFALLQSRFDLSDATAASVRDKVFVALSPYVTGQTCIAGMFGAFCVIVRRSPLVFLTAEVRDALFIHHVAHASSSQLAFTSVIEALQSLLLTHNDLADTIAVFGTAESRDRLFIPVVAVLTSDRKLGADSLFIAVVQMVITSPHFQTRAACGGIIVPLAATISDHERAASWIYVMALFLEGADARAAFATARARHEFVRMAKHCSDPQCAGHYNQALHRITQSAAACRVFATSHVRDIFPRIAKNVTSSEGAGLLFRSMALLSDGDQGHTLFATKAIRDEVFIPLAKLATNDATAAVMLASLSLILGDEGEVEQVSLFATPAFCDALLHPLEAISNSETSGIASAMLHQLTRGFDDGMEQRCALIAQRPAMFRILSRSATTERAVGLFLGPLFNVASQCPMQNHGGLLGDLIRLAGMVGTAATADMFLCALYAYFDRVGDSVNVTDEVRDKLVVALGSHVCSATGVRSFCDVVTMFLRGGAVGSLFRHSSMHGALNRMAEYATTADAAVAVALVCRELDESRIDESLRTMASWTRRASRSHRSCRTR